MGHCMYCWSLSQRGLSCCLRRERSGSNLPHHLPWILLFDFMYITVLKTVAGLGPLIDSRQASMLGQSLNQGRSSMSSTMAREMRVAQILQGCEQSVSLTAASSLTVSLKKAMYLVTISMILGNCLTSSLSSCTIMLLSSSQAACTMYMFYQRRQSTSTETDTLNLMLVLEVRLIRPSKDSNIISSCSALVTLNSNTLAIDWFTSNFSSSGLMPLQSLQKNLPTGEGWVLNASSMTSMILGWANLEQSICDRSLRNWLSLPRQPSSLSLRSNMHSSGTIWCQCALAYCLNFCLLFASSSFTLSSPPSFCILRAFSISFTFTPIL